MVEQCIIWSRGWWRNITSSPHCVNVFWFYWYKYQHTFLFHFYLHLHLSFPPPFYPPLLVKTSLLSFILSSSSPWRAPCLIYSISHLFSLHHHNHPTPGRVDLQPQLDSAMQDVTDMCLLMEETEKQAVRRALVEERGRFCTFIGFLQPVVVRRWRRRGGGRGRVAGREEMGRRRGKHFLTCRTGPAAEQFLW